MAIKNQTNVGSKAVINLDFNQAQQTQSKQMEIVNTIEAVIGAVDTITAYADKFRLWNAKQADKKQARQFVDKAIANERCGNYTAEVYCYLNAVKLDPQYSDAHNGLAWALAMTNNQLDKALFHAKQAVELNPENACFHDTLAEVYFHMDDADLERAEQHSNEALRLSTRKEAIVHHMCNHRLGRIRILQGKPSAAIEALNKCLEINTFDSRYNLAHTCYLLAIAHRENSNIPLALRFATRAYEIAPATQLTQLMQTLSKSED